MATPRDKGKTDDKPDDKTPVNRWSLVFGDPLFAVSESSNIYTRGEGARQQESTPLATVIVPYKGIEGGGVSGTIYAKKRANQPAYAEFSFAGTQRGSAIVATTEAAKTELAAFRVMVCELYAKWADKNGGAIKAPRTSAAVEMKGLDSLFAQTTAPKA